MSEKVPVYWTALETLGPEIFKYNRMVCIRLGVISGVDSGVCECGLVVYCEGTAFQESLALCAVDCISLP